MSQARQALNRSGDSDCYLEIKKQQDREAVQADLRALREARPEMVSQAHPCMELTRKCPNYWLGDPVLPSIAVRHVHEVCAQCKRLRENQKRAEQETSDAKTHGSS